MKPKITIDRYKSMCKSREVADLRGCKPETAYTIGFYDGWVASVSEENIRLREALELIAMPKRPDGTYNRSREACEQLAKEALEEK